MTAAKFEAYYIFCVWLCLFHFHFHDFGLLLLVASMIFLCNHKRMVFEKPYAYHELMCPSENCQWCREPYFAVSAISIGDILPQIPRQGKHKSLWI
jgi:hypothetical protein